MTINPINIFDNIISKASEIIRLTYMINITANRANNLSNIDLRKYRGKPKKKQQIRRMLLVLGMRGASLNAQRFMVLSQPVPTQVFESGCLIGEDKEEFLINAQLNKTTLN